MLSPDPRPLLSTLDRRFWIAAALGTLAGLLVLGIPTAVIPNPFFSRMTPTEPIQLLTWLSSAPLIGLVVGTYAARPAGTEESHADAGRGRASVAGLGAFLAIGCPICNKLVVGLLGVSGALNVFGPVQPVIGIASVVLLAATAVWRLRARARACARCIVSDPRGAVAA